LFCSFDPPALQELVTSSRDMDDRRAVLVGDTPTSKGSALRDGPMNIVTAGSSVSKARQ
jgi:hypothetical protein